MIFIGVLLLLLPANVIETSRKHYVQMLTPEENCYTHSKHIFCQDRGQLQNRFYFIDLIEWGKRINFEEEIPFYPSLKNHVQFNILNLLNIVSAKYVFTDSAKTVRLQNFEGALCLNNQCSVTTQVILTVISRYNEENAAFPSSDTFEEIMLKSVNDSLNGDDMYARISKLLINRSSLNVIQEIKSILENAKAILSGITDDDHNIEDAYKYISDMQNKTDSENLLIEYFHRTPNGKNIYTISESEILFRISLFLILFITVFSFNIYYCSAIAYSVYKKDSMQFD